MRIATDLKTRVRLGESAAIWFLLTTVDAVFIDETGAEAVITSGKDGVHSEKSLHYSGKAFDFRTRHVEDDELLKVVKALKAQLGPDFDVVLEIDHLHVEWDPKFF
jgi:hypothetical protein